MPGAINLLTLRKRVATQTSQSAGLICSGILKSRIWTKSGSSLMLSMAFPQMAGIDNTPTVWVRWHNFKAVITLKTRLVYYYYFCIIIFMNTVLTLFI